MSLRGRLADLGSAFKQFAAHPDHAYARVVAVWDPVEEKVLYFMRLALMFGEAGSVFGFNRGSKFLATVVVRCADLVTTAYFDDYSQLELDKLTDSADHTFKQVCKKLGFRLSEDPRKDKKFSDRFEPLGVEVDLSRAAEGVVVIGPKAARVAKVIELAVTALRTGNLGIKEASTLQGVLRFLREGLFGRVGGRLLNALGSLSARLHPSS